MEERKKKYSFEKISIFLSHKHKQHTIQTEPFPLYSTIHTHTHTLTNLSPHSRTYSTCIRKSAHTSNPSNPVPNTHSPTQLNRDPPTNNITQSYPHPYAYAAKLTHTYNSPPQANPTISHPPTHTIKLTPHTCPHLHPHHPPPLPHADSSTHRRHTL